MREVHRKVKPTTEERIAACLARLDAEIAEHHRAAVELREDRHRGANEKMTAELQALLKVERRELREKEAQDDGLPRPE